MKKVKFERPDSEHEFQKGDEIYVIDKNKYDLWRAVVKKSSSKGYLVTYEDLGEDKKYAGTKRFLLRTDQNNVIFKEQEEKRNGNPESDQAEETPKKQPKAKPQVKKEKKNEKKSGKKAEEKEDEKDDEKEDEKEEEKTETKLKEKEKPGKKGKVDPKKKKTPEKKKVTKKAENSKKKKAAPSPKKKKPSFSDSENELTESESENEEFENDEDDDEDENDEDISNEEEDENSQTGKNLKLNKINDDDDDISKTNENDDDNNAKPKKAKKPIIINNHIVVRNAWENGIHDVDAFRTYMMNNLDTAVAEFEKLYKMNNVSEFPPFSLGGPIEAKEIAHFWIQAQSLWKRFFGDLEAVTTKEFLKKSVPYFKLPNQREANARDAMMFIFDPENQPETDFVQFCAFLASFGPPCTAIRKIGQWLKCPPELKDALLFPDIPEPSTELPEDAEMNLFTLKLNNDEDQTNATDKKDQKSQRSQKSQKDAASAAADANAGAEEGDGNTEGATQGPETEKWVYNLPNVSTEGEYLVDTEGVVYKDWLDYFEKNKSLVRKTVLPNNGEQIDQD